MRSLVSPMVLALANGLSMTGAGAMTLTEAFEAARVYDPQYRAAAHDLEAARLGVPIARGALLPQVSASYSNQGVSGVREFSNSVQQDVSTKLEYSSPQYGLSARLALFNYEALARLDQAKAQTRVAEATYKARGQDMVERVVIAYLQVLEAHAFRTLSGAEVLALQGQQRRAEERLQRGEGTRTDAALALAAVESARARLSDAEERVGVAVARLKRSTGRAPAFVNDTLPDFHPQPSPPGLARELAEQARVANPLLEVRQFAVEVARHGVRRNQAGHLPRLDLVGSVTRARNETLSNLDQSTHLSSIGIQLNLPLYSGGAVEASVSQARAELARAEEDLRNEYENNELEILRNLQAADAAAQRVDAIGKAVAAGEVAVTGATRAQEAGLGTQSDVLDARSRLFASRRELSQAQYDHLAARMRAHFLAGEPLQDIVDRINAVLTRRIDMDVNHARGGR